MNTHDIFISYSRHDLKVVQPIKEELERLGFSCWMDLEGIESGTLEFSDHIIAAIDASTAMLFFLSTDSQTSEWALKEIDYALGEKKHVVLVRFNDDALVKKFRFDFKRADIVDWRKSEQREKLLGYLCRWVEENCSRTADCSSPNQAHLDSAIRNLGKDSSCHVKKNLRPVKQLVWTSVLIAIVFLIAIVLISKCVPLTKRLDLSNDVSAEVNGLDSRDFSIAAERLIGDMLASGAVDKLGGGRYVLAIGRVANRTRQDIDVDQLVKKIRIALLRSGKVVVTTVVSASGWEDDMSLVVRDLANNGLLDTGTVAHAGMAIAPELSLSGKIIERNLRITNSKQRIEYFFQLSITDINTGLAIWEGEEVIGKIGSR